MKWVAVEDNLPETGEDVLCLSVEFDKKLCCDVLYRYRGEWWRSVDGIWNLEVTHWMPLPEFPNGISLDTEEKL